MLFRSLSRITAAGTGVRIRTDRRRVGTSWFATGLGAQAVDAGRVAILRGDAVRLLRVTNGSVLRTFRATAPVDVALQGSTMVVLQRPFRNRTLAVYDLRRRRIATWPARGAGLGGDLASKQGVDVHRGIATFPVGRSVHVLRARDGRERVLKAPRVVVAAQIEASGLVYAYGARLVFVPRTQLVSLLGH